PAAGVGAAAAITETSEIDPATGGVLRSANGRVTVTFPPGAVKRRARASISNLDTSVLSSPIRRLFEVVDLTAEYDDDQEQIAQFDQPLTLTMSYAHLPGYTIAQDMTTILWWNPAGKRWEALPSLVDKEGKKVSAAITHFSGYAGGVGDPENPRLPGVEAFQNDLFTGAANVSYPLEVPPGRGGLTPQLRLSYSSPAVTSMVGSAGTGDASRADTQAPWVGAGWDLDLGRIVRDMGDNLDSTADDHFSLSLNGIGEQIVLGSDGYYHTKNETFVRISRTNADTSSDKWYVWLKDGSKYSFEKGLLYYTGNCPDLENRICETIVREWFLTKVEDVNGNAIDVSYWDDPIKVTCRGDLSLGTYPMTVTYSVQNDDRYLVQLNRSSRNDIKHKWWDDYCTLVPYQRERLDNVKVYYDLGGTRTEIRKYQFNYDYSLFPQVYYDHSGQYGKLTLLSVTEKDPSGNSLPAYAYTYGQNNLLSTASNGYGGKTTYSYDHVTAGYFRSDESVTYVLDNVKQYPNSPVDTYTGALFPGSQYYIDAYFTSGSGSTVRIWAQDDYHTEGITVTIPSIPQGQQGVDQGEPFFLDPRATYLKVWVEQVSGDYYLKNLGAVYWRTHYRVLTKAIADGLGITNTYTITYFSPAMNDTAHSAEASWTSYPKMNTQFRGHERVEQTDPLGNKTATYFHQDDALKGKTYRLERYRGTGTLLNQEESTWVGAPFTVTVNTDASTVDHYTNDLIVLESGLSIAVSADSRLDYAIRAEQSSLLRASVQLQFSDGTNSWDLAADDQNGLRGAWFTDLNDKYNKVWYRRSIPLGEFNGKTVSSVFFMTNDNPTITTGAATHNYQFSSVVVAGRPISPTATSGTGTGVTSWILQGAPGETMAYPFVRLAETNSYSFDGAITSTRQIRSAYEYDAYGNRKDDYLFGDVNDGSDDQSVHRDFVVNTTAWIVDKPNWENVYSVITDNVGGPTMKTQTTRYYDGSTNYGASPTKGLMTKLAKGMGGDYVSTWEYGYDSYGNRILTLEPGGRSVTTTYDAIYRTYPVAETISPTVNGVTQRQTAAYDYRFAKPTALTDTANLAATSYAYDTFGRTVKVWQPTEPTSVKPTQQVTITDGSPGVPTMVLVESRTDLGGTNTPALYRQWSFYDGLGRLVQTQADSDTAGQVMVKSIGYDALGRKDKESVAITNTTPVTYRTPVWANLQKTSYAYDALGRTVKATAPDGSVSLNAYSGWGTATRDGNGHGKFFHADAFGRLAKVEEPLTTYQDTFDTKDQTKWTFSAYQTVPFADGGNNVVKSTGTGVDYTSEFYANSYTLRSGQGIQIEFKMTLTDTRTHIALETNDGGVYRRWAVRSDGNKIYVQANDGSGWTYPADLITPVQTDRWYVVMLRLDDADGFYAEVRERDNPNVGASYSQPMPAGKNWRFHHWIWTGNAYLDNYREITYQPTTYRYDTLGSLTTVTDTLGSVTSVSYDAQGRKLGMTDPDMGSWSYGYDLAGNLVRQTDAKGQTLRFAYDPDNRLVAKYDNTAFATYVTAARVVTTTPDLRAYATLTNTGDVTFSVNAPATDLYNLAVTLHSDSVEADPRGSAALSKVYVDGAYVGSVTTRGNWGPPYAAPLGTTMLGPGQTESFKVNLTAGSHNVRLAKVAGTLGVETAKDGSEIALIRGGQGAFYQYDSHLLDRFDSLDSALWNYSSYQSVDTVDNQSVLKSTGTGSSYESFFTRADAALGHGDRL
ncbi:MAG: hypothetical protein HY673_16900, partial [Chloroflexi bacterium]|nr:hypothetical protein [Chloroflexota bacterium]